MLCRCPRCGHGYPYRAGLRYCAACAAPVAIACGECGCDNLIGDRHCAFCASPLGANSEAGAAVPPLSAEAAERTELLDLAREARERASRPLPELATKPHMSQDDLDRLFER